MNVAILLISEVAVHQCRLVREYDIGSDAKSSGGGDLLKPFLFHVVNRSVSACGTDFIVVLFSHHHHQ